MADQKEWKDWKACGGHHSTSSAVYGLGFLGALVYYIQHADSFSAGLMGVVKAIFWPAVFVYKAIEMMGF